MLYYKVLESLCIYINFLFSYFGAFTLTLHHSLRCYYYFCHKSSAQSLQRSFMYIIKRLNHSSTHWLPARQCADALTLEAQQMYANEAPSACLQPAKLFGCSDKHLSRRTTCVRVMLKSAVMTLESDSA